MTSLDVKRFLLEVNLQRKIYYDGDFPNLSFHNVFCQIPKRSGGKYIKLICNQSVWGFIAKEHGSVKGFPVRRGDLLFPASYSSPARHSRGNILDGTAMYGPHGPSYLK